MPKGSIIIHKDDKAPVSHSSSSSSLPPLSLDYHHGSILNNSNNGNNDSKHYVDLGNKELQELLNSAGLDTLFNTEDDTIDTIEYLNSYINDFNKEQVCNIFS